MKMRANASWAAMGFPKEINWRKLWLDPSVMLLLLSNLGAIALALAYSISVMAILWAYWLQSIIIGFFNFFRILSLKDFSTEGFKVNEKPVAASAGTKVFVAVFFAIHYGFFHLVYAGFLGAFSMPGNAGIAESLGYAMPIAAGFFVTHLFSFVYNLKKDREKQNIGRVMLFPYARIIPMHITIIFGGMLLATGIGHAFVLALFMLLKTAADVGMHVTEHVK